MAQRNRTSNSSMPMTPALKGRTWTKSLRTKIAGRWVLIGWVDSPAEIGIDVSNRYEGGEPVVFFPKKGHTMQLDSPGQVIVVGRKLEDNPFFLAPHPDGGGMMEE